MIDKLKNNEKIIYMDNIINGQVLSETNVMTKKKRPAMKKVTTAWKTKKKVQRHGKNKKSMEK